MLSFAMVIHPAPPDQPRQPDRRNLTRWLQPLVDFCYKLLVATAAAIAVWKGLH
jgi:hypothetical protein